MQLLPKRIVERLMAPTQSSTAVTMLGKVPVLLVRIDDTKSLLAETLKATASAKALPSPDGDVSSTRTRLVPADRFVGQRTRAPAAFDDDTLRAQLEATTHFIALVMKRQLVVRDPRVKIGRSTTNDIVLQDPAVSSTHAWLDVTDDGVHFITDAGSKNRTHLNGKKLEPKNPVDVYPGDKILFGSVETTFCTLGKIRRALGGKET